MSSLKKQTNKQTKKTGEEVAGRGPRRAEGRESHGPRGDASLEPESGGDSGPGAGRKGVGIGREEAPGLRAGAPLSGGLPGKWGGLGLEAGMEWGHGQLKRPIQ